MASEDYPDGAEVLTRQQQELGDEIERLVRNYKKDSTSRKTPDKLQLKLDQLENLWIKFDAINDELRSYASSLANHPYFSQRYFEKVREGYQMTRNSILQLINASSGSASSGEIFPRETGQPDDEAVITIKGLIRRQRATVEVVNHLINRLNDSQPSQTRQFYEVKLSTLQQYWDSMKQTHQSICEQTDDVAAYGYNSTDYLAIEDSIQEAIVRLTQCLEKTAIQTSNIVPACTSLNLPKIVLPKFDGDYMKWQQFHDLFHQMVHQQPLGHTQKMWYLKNNLSGEAERLIRHLHLSDSNYITAWDILNRRYNNQRVLVSALLDKLLSQPTITTESAVAIKRFHDATKESLLGLTNLNISTTSWDPILLHLLVKRIDKTTHSPYEQSLKNPRECQSVNAFLSFLEQKFQSLEALGGERRQAALQKTPQSKSTLSMISSTTNLGCKVCKGNHKIFACESFLKLNPCERLQKVRSLRLCINCLKDGHTYNQCKSRNCLKCNKNHNTLLHVDTNLVSRSDTTVQSMATNVSSDVSLAAHMPKKSQSSYVLLGTAQVTINKQDNTTESCRAILDSGSQINFISERMYRKLKIPGINTNIEVAGIGATKTQTTIRVNIQIASNHSGYSTRLEAYVIPDISSVQPQMHIEISSWPIPQNIKLADEHFNKPRRVDLLLGAEFYCELMVVGQIKLGKNLPTLQNTVLGWVVLGRESSEAEPNLFCGIRNIELDRNLEKFWAIEESLPPATSNPEEPVIDLRRKDDGRFEARLPLLQNPKALGQSRELAVKRFLAVERKLNKDSEMKRQYAEFLNEYTKLGHMEQIDERVVPEVNYFLPHHCVLKPTSSTTNLRVVFDASAKTSSNLSLNDIMMKGPTIQDDLFSILLRFRTHKYVFSADIEKMYRQVSISPKDRNLQLIVWRENTNESLRYYQLNTVTYGTTAAPYIATKCLAVLADSAKKTHPLAARAIQDFYVDDIMTGSNNLQEAVKIQRELKELLQSAGFTLRKWCSNHPQLLSSLPMQDVELQLEVDNNTEGSVKTLGLSWRPRSDKFAVTTSCDELKRVTKRTVLRDISRLFDPLGFINPVVVTAKIFLQQLWALKLDWDAAIPIELHTRWLQFREEFNQLNTVRIPRYLETKDATISLHAFSDASEKAYGAVIYVRSVDNSGQIKVTLLCAKSKVAPVRTITLPRLELCAAKLMANLVARVQKILRINICDTHYWTDSQIVLAWIQSSPSSFHTFVANRISSIQELTKISEWRYINTKLNPADLVSRGTRPSELIKRSTWIKGPEFLSQPESYWPCDPIIPSTSLPEGRPARRVLTVTKASDNFLDAIDHKNSFEHLKRVTAYVLRAVNCFKKKKTGKQLCTREIDQSKKVMKNQAFLTPSELSDAVTVIVKHMQSIDFKAELKRLKERKPIDEKNKLIDLTPFLDKQSVIRVGGRLQNANIPFETKYQILLSSSHPFTKLLLTDLHVKNLHVGPLALHSLARQQFWILRGRRLATSVVHGCVRCNRFNPQVFSQRMGNLLGVRVQSARPFLNVGIDFCGPIYTHYKIRGKRPTKSYICVFCCMATKACHLEVVSDLTTDGFIAALKRFSSRRGYCKNIYCDNATNFVGAQRQLVELQMILDESKSQEKITKATTGNGIQFHFIPPRGPHFGGIWEAAVKSAKHLLQKTIASASLTYEELCTVTAEIEAILNSRPITPMSNNPNDLTALTPGHFLIGEPLTSIISNKTIEGNPDLLTRWKLVQYIRNEFWRRWSSEYLGGLQQRSKWKMGSKNIQPDMLVLIKDKNMPPLKWQLGRVEKVIAGEDGLVRVVDVKTSTGIFRRAIQNLCPLLKDEEEPPKRTCLQTNQSVPQIKQTRGVK